MANNKTKKTFLIQGLITNIVILVILFSVFVFYFYPHIKVSIQDKEELLSLYNQHETIVKGGISYEEFVALHQWEEWKDTYKDNIIKTIAPDFYTKNIINTSDKIFNEYIESKKNEIISSEKSAWYEKSQDIISMLIPQYAWNTIDTTSSGNILTDYMYINYLENLFYTFNLDVLGDGLTINETISIDENKSIPGEWVPNKWIESNIFYIPISFNLEGKKKDIINFLHFTERVWSASISKNDEIVIYNDRELVSVFWSSKNPYEGQLFDIESINMKDYLDSFNAETVGGLINFVKSTQANESFELEVNLRFYVRGKPNYQLKNFISSELQRFDALNKKVLQTLSRVSNMPEKNAEIVVISNVLRSLTFDILNLDVKTKEIKAWYVKVDSNLEDYYRQSLQLKKTIDVFENIFKKNEEKLNKVTGVSK